MGRRLAGLGFATATASACLTACGGGPSSPDLVVLVSIDTLRADHLGCYGYTRDTSPAVDRLAAEGILFEQAYAHASSTLSSHASLLTSLIPQHHGASHAGHRALPAAAVTLAEVFLRTGWRTASFNGGGQLARELGLAQGFEVYESLPRREDRFSRIVELGLRWLDAHAGERRFLFLHTYEVHQPPEARAELLSLFTSDPEVLSPEPPGPASPGSRVVSESHLAWYVDRYDAEVRSMDEALGELVEALRGRGLWDETLLVLTSDHGEELGERGRVAKHALTLFDEVLRVPLVLKLPVDAPGAKPAGRRVTAQARLIDVAPTVLSAAGIAGLEAGGVDLLAGGSSPRPLVAYRDTATVTPVAALRTAGWKRIGRRLFDLRRDPRETVDVATRFPDVARRLDRYVEEVVASGPAFEGRPVEPLAETEEQLRALGYVD